MTVLRPHLDNDGLKVEGDIIDVSEQRAAELEMNNLAIGVVGGKMMPRTRPVPLGGGGYKEGSVTISTDPMMPRPIGGPTGAETPVSLSVEAPPQPRQKRTYRKRGVEPKS